MRAQEGTIASTKNDIGKTYQMVLSVTKKTVDDIKGEYTSGISTHSALTATHGATGAIVGTTNSQTLTNKTLTDATNNITARSLKSVTTTVDVSGATAPLSGQVLTATSNTTATWQTPAAGLALPPDIATSMSNNTAIDDTLAAFFDMVYDSASGAAILNSSNLTVARAATIISNANLTALKLSTIFQNAGLTETRRVQIAYALNNLGGKTPTVSGGWQTSPTNLANITDNNNITTITQGTVYAPGSYGSNTGYINIDIGSIVPIKVMTIKWTGSSDGPSGGHYYRAATIKMQRSTDNLNWTDFAIVSWSGNTNEATIPLSYNNSVLIDANVRYVRVSVSTSSGGMGSEDSYARLSTMNFVLG